DGDPGEVRPERVVMMDDRTVDRPLNQDRYPGRDQGVDQRAGQADDTEPPFGAPQPKQSHECWPQAEIRRVDYIRAGSRRLDAQSLDGCAKTHQLGGAELLARSAGRRGRSVTVVRSLIRSAATSNANAPAATTPQPAINQNAAAYPPTNEGLTIMLP